MAPVIDVDLDRLQEEGDQRGREHLREPLIGRGREHQPNARRRRDADQQQEQKPANPSAIGEGADVGVVRFETEDEPEAEGTRFRAEKRWV